MQTRYAIILLDGAADRAIEALDGRTPLQTAATPNIGALARRGRSGTVRTIPDGLPALPDVAILSLLGCSLRQGYCGRGPIDLAAHRIRLADDEIALRCDFVTMIDGELHDVTAGNIPTAQARQLVDAIESECRARGVRIVAGTSNQQLAIMSEAVGDAPVCSTPYDVARRAVRSARPRGRHGDRLIDLMTAVEPILAAHDVNLVRQDLGESPANAVWFWGAGRTPRWPRFRARFDIGGAVVCHRDMMRGLSTLLGMRVIAPDLPERDPGAAQPDAAAIDAEIQATGRAALSAIDKQDLLVVHAPWPDDASLSGDADAKVRVIEAIDSHIVGPVADAVARSSPHRIMAACTIANRVEPAGYLVDDVPFVLAGTGLALPDDPRSFTEPDAAQSDLHVSVGAELMEYVLRV
jgi:2,3-bisphosphoglycerate-independent phosphoglycerate mutase